MSNFDIPARNFDFVKDLAYGHEGESLVSSFLDSLSGGEFEVNQIDTAMGVWLWKPTRTPRV